ncbi:kinase-like domain-containing protein, partial [Baffinella frigidus]
VTYTGIVKLIDFGLSYLGDPSLIPAHSVFAGTPVYLPPEVLREEQVTLKQDVLREEEATFKQDVYSFGILFWEMLAQEFPFDAMTLKQATPALRPTHAKMIHAWAPQEAETRALTV